MEPVSYVDKLAVIQMLRGYVLKTILDSLSQTTSNATFTLMSSGMYYTSSNNDSSLLFDISMERDQFLRYYCAKKMRFSFNLSIIKKVINSTLKKQSLTLVITKDNPDQLTFIVQGVNETDPVETGSVQIKMINDEDITEEIAPDHIDEDKKIPVYSIPYTIIAKQLQGIKKLANISKETKIRIQGSNFFAIEASDATICNLGYKCGKIENPEDVQEELSEEDRIDEEALSAHDHLTRIEGVYEAVFQTKTLASLTKLSSICTQISFYPPAFKECPLKMELTTTGNLANVAVYIKDKTQVAYEKTKKAQDQSLKMACH